MAAAGARAGTLACTQAGAGGAVPSCPFHPFDRSATCTPLLHARCGLGLDDAKRLCCGSAGSLPASSVGRASE